MSSIIKAPIPLKKVNVSKIFKNQTRGIRVNINGSDFIGGEHFIIKEELAIKKRKGLLNMFNTIEDVRVMEKDTFKENALYEDYKCSDVGIEYEIKGSTISLIILKTDIGEIVLNYDYYSYFKALGVELRFKSPVSAIGMFNTNKEFVGLVLPIRRVKND